MYNSPYSNGAYSQQSSALADQTRVLAAQRQARLKAWKAQNPGASAGESLRYARQLEAEDGIKLAGARSNVREAQRREESIMAGFDPETGNRLVDVMGHSVRPGGDAAGRIATFHNIPGTRAVDTATLNKGEVEDWGYRPVQIGHTPKAGPLSRVANGVIAGQQVQDFNARLRNERGGAIAAEEAALDDNRDAARQNAMDSDPERIAELRAERMNTAAEKRNRLQYKLLPGNRRTGQARDDSKRIASTF